MIIRLACLLLIFITTLIFSAPWYAKGAGVNFSEIDATTSATPIIDGVTGASRPEFSTLGFIRDTEQLKTLMNDHQAVCILSTTNSDGSLHASIIQPKYTEDNQIKFALPLNRSRKNLDLGGGSVIIVYLIDCKNTLHTGAQVILKPQKNMNKAEQNTKGLRVITMQIEKILPLMD